jgi:hypothetical protein
MQIVRFIFLFVFISFFTHVKGADTIKLEKKVFSKEKSCDLKLVKISFDSDNDICRVLKRKYKFRGVEVSTPFVSNVPCNQVTVYSKFIYLFVKDNYASFLYCVDHKRGPPVV